MTDQFTAPFPAERASRLGLFSLVCLVIGNMIGTGIYVSSGYSLASIGDAKYVLLIWAIAGFHALAGSIAYAAVAKRLPVSGGEYAILSRWVHPAVGFLAGWISIFAGFAAPIAAAAKLIVKYVLGASIESNEYSSMWASIAAIFVIVIAGSIRLLDLRWNAIVNNFVIFIKLAFITVFIAIGIMYFLRSGNDGFVRDSHGVIKVPSSSQLIWSMFGSLFFTTLAYTGFNASIYIAGDYRNRDGESLESNIIPRSMVIACSIVIFLYMGLNIVFLYSLPGEQVVQEGERYVLLVAKQIGGSLLEAMLWTAIVLSSITSILAMMMTGPHVYKQLATDYQILGCQNGHSNSSSIRFLRIATVVQMLIASVIASVGSLKDILEYLGLTLTTCGAIAIGSLWYRTMRGASNGLSVVTITNLNWIEKIATASYVLGGIALFCIASQIIPIQFYLSVATMVLGCIVYFTLPKNKGA